MKPAWSRLIWGTKIAKLSVGNDFVYNINLSIFLIFLAVSM